jgi:hypothetical protein
LGLNLAGVVEVVVVVVVDCKKMNLVSGGNFSLREEFVAVVVESQKKLKAQT